MLKCKYHKLVPALLLTAFSWCLAHAASATVPSLPVLNWQPYSDWVNVKTDVTPAAVGDGVHDDTAALQAGLNILPQSGYGRKTLYLPAGTYRISKTLTLTKVTGAMIVGQGQATRIVWGGPPNQAMLLSNGSCYGRYTGIVWDGANVAAVGIDHQTHTLYESVIRHEDEAFVNFRDSGIRVGLHEMLPTSEMSYHNCLFQNCANGVAFLAYNDVNNNFSGCEFQDNGISINSNKGNVYVRDCHFERSRTTDIFLENGAQSIRRCTSVGSKQFLQVPYGAPGCAVTAQDCHVDGWTGTHGAMSFGMFGPNTVFDCSFTHPPDTKAPIRLTNWPGVTQTLLSSNNSAPGSTAVADLGGNGHLMELPAGARGSSLSDPARSFLRSTETVPSAVLDVKSGFGATGDGYHDDTVAITTALNAAKAQAGGVVLYFPAGRYIVSSTLPISGGNYSLEGSGNATVIHWSGPHGGTVFSVQDPQGISLKQMSFDVPLDVACIQQTSAGAASSQISYERLWAGRGGFLSRGDVGGNNGHIAYSPGARGLECIGLPASSTVHLSDFMGAVHFTDCSRAVILGDFVGGIVQVDGAQYEKTGFLGILAHNNAGCYYDVIVRDNQDFVGTDFYTESTNSALYVSGDGALVGQPGHVSIQGSRVSTYDTVFARVDNYEGHVSYTGSGLEQSPSSSVLQTGTRPVDLVLFGNALNSGQPTVTLDAGGQLTLLENVTFANVPAITVPDCLPSLSAAASLSFLSSSSTATQAALAPAVATLDDFRLLGAYDLAINYP